MITKNSLNIVEKITKQIPSFHHHYHILYDLSNLINKDKINYLEIGAYGGASAILMLHNPNVYAFSIDIGYPIKKEDVIKNISVFFKDERYIYIKGDSQKKETKEELFKKINKVDILFIDGDHSYQAVLNDFKMYSDMVEKNGYIVFDDYRCSISPQVKPAVDYIVKNLNKENFEIIGTLKNLYSAYPEELKDGNCFIIKKL